MIPGPPLAVLAALLLSFVLCAPGRAAGQSPSRNLASLSIEELMQIDVMLATREAELARLTAAAITVVTADDIRRSGVTTMADAVALADGVHVARFNNGSWAVSARGFNATGANKLLVMVDGRTEYSPLFAGAFWNMLDYVLEDVDRIEVIRGPGATLWGANAVNGVINIITKHSRDTRGAYVALGAGNEDPSLVDLRYGGGAGDTTFRVYGKYAHRAAQVFETGGPSDDARRRGQAGFRLDRGSGAADQWLLKGDVFSSRDDFPDRPAAEFTQLALQAGWARTLAPDSQLSVSSYYRREHRDVPQQLTHHIDTIDVDAQHGFRWRDRHRVIWGAGYRRDSDETSGGSIAFVPQDRVYSIFSAFAQDEIAATDRLRVTFGVKLERNAFSGAEWQPNVRGRLELTPRQMIWGAVSRAVRRPTRLDVDVRAFSPTGALVAIGGGEAYRGESLLAGEMGYRAQPHPLAALDAVVFVHGYDDLRSQELPASGPPIVVGNTLNGRSRGVELAGTVQPQPAWRMRASYTYLDVSITRDLDSRDVAGGTSEANDPQYIVNLRTDVDVSRTVAASAFLRRIGSLPNPRVPAYTELNMRLSWQATPRLELALAGQDLLHARHPEFGAPAPRRVAFQRSVRLVAAFRY